MRFLKEFFTPRKKCERIGHKIKKVSWTIERPSAQYALEKAKADFEVCTRCGYRSLPFNIRFVEGFHEATMPSERWDSMNRDGYIISEK